MSFIELDLDKIVVGTLFSNVEQGGNYYQRQTSFPSSLYSSSICRLTDPLGLSREVPDGGANPRSRFREN